MRMKCACVQGTTTSYERLPNVLVSDEGADRVQSDIHQNRELTFFNDDETYQTVLVERDLCASDLCQLLALKNRLAKSLNWTIVEHWPENGMERRVEDHEKVLEVYRSMEHGGGPKPPRFIFRKNFLKYEFFLSPKEFFPIDMVDFPDLRDIKTDEALEIVLQNMLASGGHYLRMLSNVWIMDNEKRIWTRAFLIMRYATLYLSLEANTAKTLMKHWHQVDNHSTSGDPVSPEEIAEEWNNVHVVGMLMQFNIYRALNARHHQGAPSAYTIILRSPDKRIDAADPNLGLVCLACDSERVRTNWIYAMRLAKYGKQLKENYKAFKNKQAELQACEYNSLTVPNESVRSRVAMDFTGSVGRIVEDPREIRAIVAAEGYNWKRRWRTTNRASAPASAQSHAQGLDSGVHITQAWFHSGMTRDQATQLVNRHGTVDGVFLVRESRSNPGSYVLTFRCGGKVIHNQIQPTVDPVRDATCYTLDNGVTKFYDLLQLIEFYQLNAGCLPTRLTHYLVQSPTGASSVHSPPNSPPDN